MKLIQHWTPRYITNRIADMGYRRACPDHPWLTKSANNILAGCLNKSDRGLEFGSGRSTLWIAKRVQHLTSVESNKDWHDKVEAMLKDNGLENVDQLLIPKDKSDDEADSASYVAIVQQFDQGSLDFALVDGVYRDFCALNVIDKLRPGGMLIIDNSNRFLPSNTHSPHSRTPDQGPKGRVWESFSEEVSDWRRVWTSSGVTDTVIFFKPCA